MPRAAPPLAILMVVATIAVAVGTAGCLQEATHARKAASVVEGGTRPATRSEQLAGLYGPATDRVRIVVHAHPGYAPSEATTAGVVQELGRLTAKPVEVDVREEPSPYPAGHAWTEQERRNASSAARAEPWPPHVALAHLFAMQGCYANNATRPCIGGVSGDVAWVFLDADEAYDVPPELRNPATKDLPLLGWYRTERWLYTHELGHLFGLVGVIPQVEDRLDHDEACECHSLEEDSTMFHFNRGLSPPTDDAVETFQQDDFQVYTYGARDLQDARAFAASLAQPAD